jgi:hypothetical protein
MLQQFKSPLEYGTVINQCAKLCRRVLPPHASKDALYNASSKVSSRAAKSSASVR